MRDSVIASIHNSKILYGLILRLKYQNAKILEYYIRGITTEGAGGNYPKVFRKFHSGAVKSCKNWMGKPKFLTNNRASGSHSILLVHIIT